MAKYCCKICGNKNNNNSFVAKEMMFDIKDRFKYFECSKCGTLQIIDKPNDLNKYYPAKYYSYKIKSKDTRLKPYFKRIIFQHLLARKNPLIYLFPKILRSDDHFFTWIREAGLNLDSKILDIGSGSGEMISKIREYGYKNLFGVDPYLKYSINLPGVEIFNCGIEKLDGKYDFIYLRHSFEHLENPRMILKKIFSLLKPNRYLLIITPIVGYAWEKYKTNWVQLDAPRHLFIYSPKSIKILARNSGYEVKSIKYVSSDFQFWGSEQYLKGIPLFSSKSYQINKAQSIFSAKDVDYFKRKADYLNKKRDGDTVAIYLYKPSLGR